MGIKVQFNDSTSKASYTSGTGKVQVFDDVIPSDCEDCSTIDTITELTVTFSDIVFASGSACCSLGPNQAYKWQNVPDFNGEYTLAATSDPCIYRYSEAISPSIARERYTSCGFGSTKLDEVTYDTLYIEVRRFVAEIEVRMSLVGFAQFPQCFQAPYTEESNCFNVTDIASTLTSSCFSTNFFGRDGTVTVAEVL